LCINGFKIPSALAGALISKEKEIRRNSVLANIFVNNVTGKLLKQNDTVKMLLLGETLRKISKSNTSDIFYNGELTKNIIDEINENGMYFLILNK
jgi:gamma-glutamyltranspeptidase